MSFFSLIKDEKLLEKYSEIWKKVSSIIKKVFDSKPVYNLKYVKTKINIIMKKSTQTFPIIKYQKNAFNVFVYQ